MVKVKIIKKVWKNKYTGQTCVTIPKEYEVVSGSKVVIELETKTE